MNAHPSIKILTSYHLQHKGIKTEIVDSIQVGAAIADSHFEGMLHDDKGDNISALNGYYCELCAQYWAWKNYDSIGNPDYIGFMHDRRHFLFNEEIEKSGDTWLEKSSYYYYPFITDEYIRQNFDNSLIKDAVEGNDVIVPKPFDFRNHFVDGKNANKKENFSAISGQNVENYDLLMIVTKNMFPSYIDDIEYFKNSNFEYLCNMYIMKRELFFEYANFLFSVLERVRSLVDDEWYTINGKRYLGYLGEFLFNIFVLHELRVEKIKINETPMMVMISREDEVIRPVFEKNFCAVALPCSDFYAPYLSVWLQSLIESSSDDCNYDIIVLQTDISKKNRDKLTSMVALHDNISLRFFNPSLYIDLSKIVVKKGYLNIVSTYRIAVNKFMQGYSKVIITDVDLVIRRNIMDLYSTDIGSAPIAAEIDTFNITNYSRISWLSDFVCNTLEMTDKYRYVNTGVMILNIDSFNENGFTEKLRDFLQTTTCSCLEQDAMNAIFDNDTYLLDSRWNVLLCDEDRTKIVRFMPEKLYEAWKFAMSDPWIMHWCGVKKPWFYPDEYMANVWWDIARRTPYYEEIIARLREHEIRDFVTKQDQILRKEFTDKQNEIRDYATKQDQILRKEFTDKQNEIRGYATKQDQILRKEFTDKQNEIRGYATKQDQILRKEFTERYFYPINNRIQSLFMMPYYTQIRLGMIRCRLLKHLCFGETKKHYREKYTRLKALYRRIRDIKREWKRKVK